LTKAASGAYSIVQRLLLSTRTIRKNSATSFKANQQDQHYENHQHYHSRHIYQPTL